MFTFRLSSEILHFSYIFHTISINFPYIFQPFFHFIILFKNLRVLACRVTLQCTSTSVPWKELALAHTVTHKYKSNSTGSEDFRVWVCLGAGIQSEYGLIALGKIVERQRHQPGRKRPRECKKVQRPKKSMEIWKYSEIVDKQ